LLYDDSEKRKNPDYDEYQRSKHLPMINHLMLYVLCGKNYHKV